MTDEPACVSAFEEELCKARQSRQIAQDIGRPDAVAVFCGSADFDFDIFLNERVFGSLFNDGVI